MEFILFVVVAVVVLMFIGAARRSSTSPTSDRRGSAPRDDSTEKQRILKANQSWLNERWHMADAEKAAGALKHFPKWFFHEATDRQRARLAADGISITRGASKGQHSDVIGLLEDPDSEDLEKLKFFDVVLKGPMRNQTRARHEVALLDSDPEKQRAWLARPASAMQKEFYRFIGEKPPPGLTCEQAEAKMTAAHDVLTEAQQDEWADLENMIEEFDDRDLRSDLEIRKPSPSDIRAAMLALKAEGKESDDPYEIAERLLSMKPALRRAGTA